jgi:hemolysin III
MVSFGVGVGDLGLSDFLAMLGCQPISAYSHLIAAGVALASAVPLVRLGRGSKARVFALSIYASSVVIGLGISGIYHSCDRGGLARVIMQRLDYFAIWALIAGTFTGIHGSVYRGFWRGGFLAIIWGYAAIGMTLQALWFEAFSGNLGLALYLGMGWIGVASIVKLSRDLGFRAVRPILYSGVAYSAGAILEARGLPVIVPGIFGPHETFHFAVITGIGLNWMFVRRLLEVHADRIGVRSRLRAGLPLRVPHTMEVPAPSSDEVLQEQEQEQEAVDSEPRKIAIMR